MKPCFLFSITMILFICSSNKQISELYSQPESLENKKFRYVQIEGNPQPVKHYFKYVLKDGQPYLSQLRLNIQAGLKPLRVKIG